MKKSFIVATIACVGLLVFNAQHRRRVRVEKQNTRLASMTVTLKERSEENARRQAAAEVQLSSLEAKRPIQKTSQTDASQNKVARAVPIPPDPSHQGGWPKGTDYFYLPKAFLQQASFQMMADRRLSDEVAKLYNFSETERDAVNRAIGDLFAKLRSAESDRMELIELPDEWCHGEFESGIAYHIPAFAGDVVAWRRELQQRLEATLGGERSSLFGQGLDNYLRQEWNDLGEGERTVGFVWRPETSGNESVWYAIKDQRHGAGTFRRYLPGWDAESAVMHYAELFGVELPKSPF